MRYLPGTVDHKITEKNNVEKADTQTGKKTQTKTHHLYRREMKWTRYWVTGKPIYRVNITLNLQ